MGICPARNRVLQQDWHDSSEDLKISAIGLRIHPIIRKQARPPLDDWHWLYADDVQLDSRQAPVIWDPSQFHGVVPMIASSARVAAGFVDLTGAGGDHAG